MQRLVVSIAVWIVVGMCSVPTRGQTVHPAPDLEDLQRKYDAAVREIERLQQALTRAQRAPETAQQQTTCTDQAPAEDFLLAGQVYLSAKRYQEAMAAFGRAIACEPREATAYRYRGLVYAHLGNTAQALEDFSKAVELNPKDAVAYNQRGIVRYATNDLPQAQRDFTTAIDLQPKLAEAHNNRCLVRRKLGDYPPAIKDCSQAAELGMASAKEHLEILRDEVRQVQERLRAAGENPGPSDGAPGAQTVAALRQYQRAHGLPITGLLDEATQRALGVSAAPPPSATTAGDVAPRFTRQTSPEYPPEARQQGLEGTVTLHLELLADGTVGEVKVAQSSGHALLDTAAQETARTWTHTPAMHNGTAVTQWVKLSLTFSLDKAAPESPGRKKTRR